MSDLVILGVNEFTEQPARRKFNLGSGWVTTRTWIGPNDDTMVRNQEDYVRTLGAMSIDTDTSIPCTISGTFPDQGGQTPIPDANAGDNSVWELVKMEVDKKLSSHRKWNNGDVSTRALQAKELIRIDKAIRSADVYDPSSEAEPYKSYAILRLQGVESYTRYTYIIKQQYSLSNAAAEKLDFANTMRVLSYSEIGVPSTVKWATPSFIDWDGSAFTAEDLEWLCLPADITFNTRTKKTDIQRTWQGAVEFSGTLYFQGSATP